MLGELSENEIQSEALVAKVELPNGQMIYMAEDYDPVELESLTALERLNFFKKMGKKIKSAASKVGGKVKSSVKKVKNWVRKNEGEIRSVAETVGEVSKMAAPEIEKIHNKDLKSIAKTVVNGG